MCLGRNDAFRAVRRAQLFQNIEADIGDPRSRGRQSVNGGVKGRRHLRVKIIEKIASWNGKAKPGRRKGGFGPAIAAGHQIIQNGAAFNACRHWPGGVEGCRQRIDAGGGHPAGCRFHSDDPAQGGRRAGRPAGIGADGCRRHAIGDRHGASRGRPAGDAALALITAIGAARVAVMWIHPKPGIGEFGHVRAADDDESGGAKTRHHGGIVAGRRGIIKHP